MCVITVALPLYNAKDIAWLALESLCFQKNSPPWELIICEEQNEKKINYLDKYKERLKNANCIEIKYIPIEDKITLAKKWQIIGKNVNESSKLFFLQAADCYSSPNRLSYCYSIYNKGTIDWIDYRKGFFYSFISRRFYLYDYKGKTNLDMCFKTEYAKNIPDTTLEKGIDGFLFDNCKEQTPNLKVHNIDKLFLDRFDTHGFNNISISREKRFRKKPLIFKQANRRIEDFILPNTIIKKLKDLQDVYNRR